MWYSTLQLRSIAFTLAIVCASSTSSATEAKSGRFDVKTSVEMSYFGTSRSSQPNELDDDGLRSPDGRFFVKLTHRGLLPSGANEATLWLIDAISVRHGLADQTAKIVAPSPLLRMSATTNGLFNGIDVYDAGNIIFQVKWTDDSRSLTFLGRNGRNNRQLFKTEVATGRTTALSLETQDVLTYADVKGIYTYLAGADADVQKERAWQSTGPGIPDIALGTGISLMPLLYPNFDGEAFGEPVNVEIWRVVDGHAQPIIDPKTKSVLQVTTKYDVLTLAPSPDNTKLSTIAYSGSDKETINTLGPAAQTPELQYQVIDTNSGTRTPLVNTSIAIAPWGHLGRYRIAWSADEMRVAVSETNLTPITGGRASATARCNVAVVKLRGLDATCVVAGSPKSKDLVESLDWNETGTELTVRYKVFDTYDYTYSHFQRHGERWQALERRKSLSEADLQLKVEEGLNYPPTLIATNSDASRQRVILDPNPQLADIDLGLATVYTWIDPEGRRISGGLVKPPEFDAGRRYPLVIETHGFNSRRFLQSGYADTANAARALAARGIIVLQVQEPYSDVESWHDALGNGTDVYTAAVDQLASEGLVDPTKVAISGFSYSGWLVAASLVSAPDRFAAAEIANTDPVTLMGYWLHVDTPLASVDADAYVGARPYGEGLQKWIARAPGLQTDAIKAPVLFQAADPWHLLSFWEMYAGMRDQGKPVELARLPEHPSHEHTAWPAGKCNGATGR